ncbi:MAG: single-stranded-DNA-specific exonuclease RecJ [Patescibacteria group bacterium]
MEKVWKIAPRKYENLIDQLLYNRGIISDPSDDERKLGFFKPNFCSNLFDPFLLSGMKGAAERIKKAVEKNEKVGIFSDYDADGIPGAALLFKALKALGLDVHVYIPNREGGYGLSKEGIDQLLSKGCSLIITIDLGIRSIKETKYCKEKNVDLIITDHHLPGEELPSPLFLINPKQEKDEYPFKDLCGCAVAYKLVQALSTLFPDKISEQFLKWNLDLVAISTISDVVTVLGENRTLVKYGLIVLQKTKNIGLQELYKISNIDPATIGAYQVGFLIGPRINAPGRIDFATESFELLVTEDTDEAKKLAVSLNTKNEERQAQMSEIELQSISKIEKEKLDQNKIIIIAGDWQKGVIGPTASRLVERYGRPVILFSASDDGYTGSARSVSGVNIVDVLTGAKETILKFGGHKGAAGVSVEKSMFKKFLDKVLFLANKEIKDESLVKKVRVDAVVDFQELTFSLYDKIIQFEPFGMDNARPVFAAQNVSFENFRFVGKEENHFSAIAKEKNSKIKSIYFNFPHAKDMIKYDTSYDVAFTFNIDEWRGDKKLSLNIIDIKGKNGV